MLTTISSRLRRALRVVVALAVLLQIVAASVAGRASADSGEAAPGSPRRGASALAAGEAHSCALASGAIRCWGDNTFGQLGLGDTEHRGDQPGEMGGDLPVVDLGAGRTAVAVAAGTAHTCAILDTRQVKCWGANSAGQLGLGDTDDRGDAAGEMGDALPAVDLGAGRTATAIAAGLEHTCALLDDSTVKCWGDNAFGQLGVGDTDDRGDAAGEMGDALPAVALGTGRTAVSISVGTGHTCAVLDIHQVKCWGNNSDGQLGQGDTANRGDAAGELGDALAVVDLGTGRSTLAVSAGRFHTCAAMDDTFVRCWGDNTSGQLGTGDLLDRGDAPGEMGDALPAITHPYGAVTAITSTSFANCALYAVGAVGCWGEGDHGQLAYGDTADRGGQPGFTGATFPACCLMFAGGQPIVAIAAGHAHGCIASAEGAVKCWGRNASGQLGYGDTDHRGDQGGEIGVNQPTVELRSYVDATGFDAGGQSNCAITDTDVLKCWGINYAGQLGYGDTLNRGNAAGQMGEALPGVDLGAGRTASKVFVGDGSTCAVLDDASLRCWGENTYGELGVGDTAARGDAPGEMGDALPPVDLGTGRTAVDVAPGGNMTCAILDDGSVKCWGYNLGGSLGIGAAGHRGDGPGEMGDALPAVNLGTNRTAVDLAVGTAHACAVLDDATLKCWGQGGWGQLGSGSTANVGTTAAAMGDNLAPVALGTGRHAVAVEANGLATCALLDDASVRCWGRNEFGQLGRGSIDVIGDGPDEMGDFLPPVDLGTGRSATQITMGRYHTCALLDDGSAKCWGHNSGGQLGIGSTTTMGDGAGEMGDLLPAVLLPAGLVVQEVVAAHSHTCARTVGLAVYCWGSGNWGQLGNGTGNGAGTAPYTMANLKRVDIGGDVPAVQAGPVTPAQPTAAAATAASASATVSWTAPATDGGSAVTGYRIERTIDGTTWTTIVPDTGSLGTSRVVTGLTNGQQVRFRVRAINAVGAGAPSLASAPVTPMAPPPPPPPTTTTTTTPTTTTAPPAPPTTSPAPTTTVPAPPTVPAPTSTPAYLPLAPARLLETRGPGTVDGGHESVGRLAAGSVYQLPVAGRGGVPAGAMAAVVNLTVTGSDRGGYAAAFPCGTKVPNASNINFAAGQTVANAVLAKLGTGGRVCLFVSETTHLIVDVNGAYPAGSGYLPLAPARVLETRGPGTVDGGHESVGRLAAGSVYELPVAGRGGVPVGAMAAVVNLTVTEPLDDGYAAVFPCGTKVPNASNVNFVAGQTVANAASVKLGAGGKVCVFVSSATHVIVDVNGAHPAGGGYLALAPARVMETRAPGTVDGLHEDLGRLAAGTVHRLKVTGRAGVPAGATAVVVNMTVTDPANGGYGIVFPCGSKVPNASNINFAAGQTIANAVVAKVGTAGSVCVFVSEATHVLVDVNGAI